ncbi:MAG: YlxR family protein [Synergistaceae bacterium]|nr:YlxR family protein [Synergistaceae bacterium]
MRARMRKCLGCGLEFPKSTLLRIVRSTAGEVSVDLSGIESGRGAYLCSNAECVLKARKKNALARVLKRPVDSEIYSRIAEHIQRGRNDGIA